MREPSYNQSKTNAEDGPYNINFEAYSYKIVELISENYRYLLKLPSTLIDSSANIRRTMK